METAAMGMMGYPFLAPSPIMKATIHWFDTALPGSLHTHPDLKPCSSSPLSRRWSAIEEKDELKKQEVIFVGVC